MKCKKNVFTALFLTKKNSRKKFNQKIHFDDEFLS